MHVGRFANHIGSLDSMGLAGFSYDFGALRGERSDVGEGFASMANISLNFAEVAIFILAPVFPILVKIPTERSRKRAYMAAACRNLARQLLANTAGATDTVDSKSILGLLSTSTFPFYMTLGVSERHCCSPVSERVNRIPNDRGRSYVPGRLIVYQLQFSRGYLILARCKH
jgi:hypothetical protein